MLSFSKAPSRKNKGDLLRTGTRMGKKRILGGLLELQLMGVSREEWQQTAPSELHVRSHYCGKGMVHVITFILC